MTVVVAIEHEGRVWVGCVSEITAGDSVEPSAEPMWWRARGGVLVGYAGDVRAAHVAHQAHALQHAPREDVLAYVVRLAQRTRAALRREHIATDAVELLVAVRGRAYSVSGGAVSRGEHGYTAIGSGASVALGALAATDGQEPRSRVLAALRAACRHSASCREPVRVECAE